MLILMLVFGYIDFLITVHLFHYWCIDKLVANEWTKKQEQKKNQGSNGKIVTFSFFSFSSILLFLFGVRFNAGFGQVIIIHSSDTDGRAILGRFQTTSQTYYDDIEVRATVESIVEFDPKLDSFTEQLMEMKAAQSRVYLLYAR